MNNFVCENPKDYYMADTMYERIHRAVRKFEEKIPEDHKVSIKINNETFLLDNVGYMNPTLIIWEGHLPDGTFSCIFQHTNQINFQLYALKHDGHQKSRQKIGFVPEEALK